MTKYMVEDVEAKDFNPADHPRDKNGRFIRKNQTVNLPKGGWGRVVGTRSRGRVEVEELRQSRNRGEGLVGTGKIRVIKANEVEVSDRQRNEPERQWNRVPRRRTAEDRAERRQWDNERDDGRDEEVDAEWNARSDKMYDEHTKKIEKLIGDAIKAGQTTDKLHTLDEDGRVWTPERAKQHKEIVDELYLDAEKVPREGKSIIAGGLGGAGKSTVLGKHVGVGKKDYLTINPDDVKEKMAELGMIPKVEGLSPMEASALVHEESSHIANMLAQRAYADRRNVIWDITMSSRGSVEKRLAEMRSKGYGQVDAVFVDIPVETSVERALARHRRGMETFDSKPGLSGGYGGRYVPPAIIRQNASSKSSSANRDVFDELRESFDNWQLFDNAGTAPKRIGAGGKVSGLTWKKEGAQYVAEVPGTDGKDRVRIFSGDRSWVSGSGSPDLTWAVGSTIGEGSGTAAPAA